MNSELLKMSLSAAVPLYVEEFRHRAWDDLVLEAHAASQIVAEKGDIVLFRSRKKGESAKVFNALARGIAILSFAPGGVTAFGMHFENKRAE